MIFYGLIKVKKIEKLTSSEGKEYKVIVAKLHKSKGDIKILDFESDGNFLKGELLVVSGHYVNNSFFLDTFKSITKSLVKKNLERASKGKVKLYEDDIDM